MIVGDGSIKSSHDVNISLTTVHQADDVAGIPDCDFHPPWFDRERNAIRLQIWKEEQRRALLPSAHCVLDGVVPSEVWIENQRVPFTWSLVSQLSSAVHAKKFFLWGHCGMGRTTALLRLLLDNDAFLADTICPVYIDCSRPLWEQLVFAAIPARWRRAWCETFFRCSSSSGLMVVILDEFKEVDESLRAILNEARFQLIAQADGVAVSTSFPGAVVCGTVANNEEDDLFTPRKSRIMRHILMNPSVRRRRCGDPTRWCDSQHFFSAIAGVSANNDCVPSKRQLKWLLDDDDDDVTISASEALALLKMPFWNQWKLDSSARSLSILCAVMAEIEDNFDVSAILLDCGRTHNELQRTILMNIERLILWETGKCNWRYIASKKLVVESLVSVDQMEVAASILHGATLSAQKRVFEQVWQRAALWMWPLVLSGFLLFACIGLRLGLRDGSGAGEDSLRLADVLPENQQVFSIEGVLNAVTLGAWLFALTIAAITYLRWVLLARSIEVDAERHLEAHFPIQPLE